MAAFSNVQSGTVTLSGASNTATVSSFDTAKAILTMTYSGDAGTTNFERAQVTAAITNSTTLTFERDSTGGTITIQWYLAEFTSGVTTQQGTFASADFSSGVADKTISTVGAHAFPQVWARNSNADIDEDLFTGYLSSTTNLKLETRGTTIANQNGVWQVYDVTGSATVQSGSFNMGTTPAADTVTISSVDTSTSALFFSFRANSVFSNIVSPSIIKGELTNSTTITFERDTTGESFIVEWYVVTWTDGTTVKRGSVSMDSSTTSASASISITAADSIVYIGGINNTGGISAEISNDLYTALAHVSALSNSNITLTRGDNGGVSCVIPYQIIDFSAATGGGATFIPRVMFF